MFRIRAHLCPVVDSTSADGLRVLYGFEIWV